MNINEAKIKIDNIKASLKKWSEEYYINDAPTVDDSVYDNTLAELFQLEKEFPELVTPDSPTQTVGAGDVFIKSSTFEKTQHEISMLSLDNAFDENDLLDFDRKVRDESSNFTYFVEPKIDGLSISLIYKNGLLSKAITRGDGAVGEDVTNNAKQIPSIPTSIDFQGDITIRGEIFMPDESFARVNHERELNGEELFANPRNAASGTMRQLNPLIVRSRGLKMFAYWAMIDSDNYAFETQEDTINNLSKLGFTTTDISKKANDINGVLKAIDAITHIRDDIDYEIDGIVIKVNESSLYEEIGYTSKFPKWAIAYKFPAEVKETILLDIFPTVGRTGRITYNAKLKGVELAGTFVQRATLHNADYIRDLDLRIGDHVNVKKAGEIIPKVISSIKDKRNGNEELWKESSHCPHCQSLLVRNEGEVDQYCENEKCEGRLKEKIIHFVSRDAMNIDGLSTKQIEKFISLGWISSFADIYKIHTKREELLALEGYQEKSVTSLISSIEKSKENTLDKFIFALGIRHIGKKTAKDLAREYGSIEKISLATLDELLNNNDLGEVKSNSIINYFQNQDNKNELQELHEIGVDPIMEIVEVDKGHKLYNKKVVVTGTIEGYNRNQVKDYLEAFGAKITSSVSGSTDYLIIGNKPSQNKIDKISPEKIINFSDIENI